MRAAANGSFPRREDAAIWRDRIIGKRTISSDPDIAAHDGWVTTEWSLWEPRVYFCKPIGQGADKDMKFEIQGQSRLLQFPAELRNRILELVLPPEILSQDTNTEGMTRGDAVWKNTSAVIFTCKQLYFEGRKLAMETHTFSYDQFPRKTLLCAKRDNDRHYSWDMSVAIPYGYKSSTVTDIKQIECCV
jgi:hypothetical protein